MTSEVLATALNRATAGSLNVIELTRLADVVRLTDGLPGLVSLFERWIEHNPDAPLHYAVLFNYAVILTDAGLLDRGRACLERAIALNPDFLSAYINLGRIHEKQGALDKAVLLWSELTHRLDPINGQSITHKTMALNQIARVLESRSQDEPAEQRLRQSIEIDSSQREAVQHYVALRQRQCKWPVVAPWERVDRALLMEGISPLSIAALADDPMLHLASNWNYNKRDVGVPVGRPGADDWAFGHWAARERPKGAPLRIGYLSSDLRMHAIGFLMAELFELHDRAAVEVTAYYCGPATEDTQQARIKASVDHWVSLDGLDDAAAAQRISDDGIQILVDVNGYTRDGRTKLLALRPAPVIVNWLGFPGTMASPYHQYIIADEWVIPADSEIYYSEKVLRLPCYQPNDRKRLVAATRPTRAEAGLPEDAMVYCCFNGAHKLNSFTFERWLTILGRVPNSVLWLLDGAPEARERLWSFAEARGIARERIIFAPKAANPEHLARYPLADLFLDTLPYGAHTTASDALWMGVPILTLTGRAFASRVCTSLAQAAGLADLACGSPREYVDRAVALGRNPESIRRYRERLEAGRDACVLFDTPLLTRKLEELYRGMWADFEADRLPQPDLANLDAYFEVGIDEDYDRLEMQSVEDYPAWWREKLARRHAYRPVPADNRLWPPEAVQAAREQAAARRRS